MQALQNHHTDAAPIEKLAMDLAMVIWAFYFVV